MRRPQKLKAPPRSQVSGVFSVSAPTGGWNARDSIANMAPVDAIKLLNFFPTTTDVVLRGGNEAYATGITDVVKTLAVYNKMNGTNKLYAIDENDVWDVSSAGAATAQTVTITNAKCQYINFGDGTNNWLILVNGTDNPVYFDGTTWTTITGVSTPALSGVTLNTLIHVNEYKGRLFYIQKDSLSFWYLAAGAAGGALTRFDLSSFCTKGGYLMWMATWSFDSGNGPDDSAVFMTSEGEVIVYQGTNPSSAADWVLVGVYQIAKPLGRRSFVKFSGDLVVLTQGGVYPLSRALQSAMIDDTVALSNKIDKAFITAAQDYGANFGWDITIHPLQSAMIFNIPVTEESEHKQYVMNTITRAWCEFDSWNAECFAVYNNELYFGASTKVNKAWTGYSDTGANVSAVGRTAFNYFGSTSAQKRFTLFRPLLQVNGAISFLTGMDVDFSDNGINGLASYSTTNRATWDVSLWDQGYWTSGLEVVRQWTSPANNVGYTASGGLKIDSNNLEVHWVANDFVYEQGGVL